MRIPITPPSFSSDVKGDHDFLKLGDNEYEVKGDNVISIESNETKKSRRRRRIAHFVVILFFIWVVVAHARRSARSREVPPWPYIEKPITDFKDVSRSNHRLGAMSRAGYLQSLREIGSQIL
jgi:hypothetical protein